MVESESEKGCAKHRDSAEDMMMGDEADTDINQLKPLYGIYNLILFRQTNSCCLKNESSSQGYSSGRTTSASEKSYAINPVHQIPPSPVYLSAPNNMETLLVSSDLSHES